MIGEDRLYNGRDMLFFPDFYHALFALILLFFAFIKPFYFPILFSFPLSSFFFHLSSFSFTFPLFLLPFSYFFPKSHQLIFPLPSRGGEGVVSPGIEKQLYRLPQSQNNWTGILGLIGNPVTYVYCSIIVQYSDPGNVFQVFPSRKEVTITLSS